MLHRDIKPDNFVMQTEEDPLSPTGKSSKVKLIDFDHADASFTPLSPKKTFTDDSESVDFFGTLRFNAPEAFLGEFSQQSDLYSIGVILYLLMTGSMPFDDKYFDGGIGG